MQYEAKEVPLTRPKYLLVRPETVDGPAVRGARHRVRVPELNLLDETLEGRRQRAIQGSLSCVRTKPSKQQVSVSAVVFWQDAGSDELQLLVAAREPSMPAGLLVAQGLTIRPATAEPVASIPTPSTIGVNILQVKRDEVEVVEVRRRVVQLNGCRVQGSYARDAPAICSCAAPRASAATGGQPSSARACRMRVRGWAPAQCGWIDTGPGMCIWCARTAYGNPGIGTACDL